MEEERIDSRKICYCSKLNKYFLFPFFIPILSIISSKIIIYLIRNYEFGNIDYFCSIYICSSVIVGGLSFFISIIKTREDKDRTSIRESNTNINSTNSSIKLIYQGEGMNKKNKKKVFMILLFISILFALNVFFGQVYVVNYIVIDTRFYEILFICFLTKITLKTEIYRHQKFSIFVSFIGFVFLCIPIFSTMTKRDILVNIILVFNSFSYSLFLVLLKHITSKYFLSPYYCCLIIGIISTIFLFIILMIHSLAICGNLSKFLDTFKVDKIKIKFKFYGLLIISYLFYSITQFLVYMTVYFFSPMIFIITQIIYPLLRYATNVIEGTDYKIIDLIFNVGGYLILLISILIYHETIIFNCWGLNEDTKIFIEKRQKEDIFLMDNFDKRTESDTE